jgi:hypothetical protein
MSGERPKQKPKLSISKLVWSWPVVGGSLFFILGGGLTFMTSTHAILADISYLVGAALFLGKFLTSEESRQQPHRKRRRIHRIGITVTTMILVIALLGNHKMNPSISALEVLSLESAKRHPVISVQKSSVTKTGDGTKISVALCNCSPFETNARVKTTVLWQGEALPPDIPERTMAFDYGTVVEVDTGNINPDLIKKSLNHEGRLSILVVATYPDRGKTTTYTYEGAFTGSDFLDVAKSEWNSQN